MQLGFSSITIQAGADPTRTYPNGTLPLSFFALLGDYSYATEVCVCVFYARLQTYKLQVLAEAPIGIALLAIYALISQVMLINLLIGISCFE